MRKLASYLMTSNLPAGEDQETFLSRLNDLFDAWIDSKGKRSDSGSSALTEIDMGHGQRGELRKNTYKIDRRQIDEISLVQDSIKGQFETRVSFATIEQKIYVYCELRASGEAYHVAPLQLDVRCPRIIRDILDEGNDWYVGNTLLLSRPVQFAGDSGGTNLSRLLWHKDRNLPVVVATEYEGLQISEDFSTRLAADLSGLAIVANVDKDAAWELTISHGKHWSCFNGAVRLYWPNLSARDTQPHHHPLWTRYSLLGMDEDPVAGADRLRKQLRRRILGLSAFSVAEPDEMRRIKADSSRAEIEAAREQLRQDRDWEKLAEDYAKENDALKSSNNEYESEIDDLRSQLSNVQSALQWQGKQVDDVPPKEESPPATVAEAVDAARQEFSEFLTFGDDIDAGIQGVAKDAGPPEKILSYLDVLKQMVEGQRKASLGMSTIAWLKQKGISASGESETVLRNKEEMNRRTWKVDGNDKQFESHLKPAEATSPDRCVRIYFDYDTEANTALVGWIGRHP